MAEKKEFRHKCELRLLVCEPNPLRPDRVTVGFVLRDTNGDTPRVEVRLASNLRSIQCIYPQADLEAIEGTLLEMEPILKNVTDFEQFLQNMPAEGPADFTFLPGTALLTDSMEDELTLLTEQYLKRLKKVSPEDEESTATNAPAEENQIGRPYLRRKMQEAFRHFGLWNFVQKDIPVGKYTFQADPLKIDFGYRNNARNSYRMLHAVSVVIDMNAATTLAYKWTDIRGQMSIEGGDSQMFAVVEDPKFCQSEASQSALQLMEKKGLHVTPVSSVMQLAAEAAEDMRL